MTSSTGDSPAENMATQTNSTKLKPMARIGKKLAILIFVLVLLWVVVGYNSLYYRMTELGILSSVAFFVVLGIVCGIGLYGDDPLMLKAVKGWFTIFVLVAITGSFLLYLNAFSVLNGTLMMALVVTGLILVVLINKLRSGSMGPIKSTVETPQNSGSRWPGIAISSLLVLIICASFYVLWTSRTGEPMFDVWYTIPVRIFFPLIFLSVLTLGCLVFFRKGSSLQLGLIVAVAFLFVSIYYLVWYPSLYGDPLSQLGAVRYTARTGAIYARDYLLLNRFWTDLIKYRGYYSIVVMATRLLSFDIYWVNNVLTPLLWAIVLPISTYATTCILMNKPLNSYPKESLLAAFSGILFFRWLIAWGADPTPNTVGFLFLFFTVPIILQWVTKGGKGLIALAILGTLSAFMTHPMPGIFAAVFLYIAVVYRKMKWTIPKTVAISVSVLLYPLAAGFGQGIGQGLGLQSLFSIQSFIQLEETLLTVSLVLAIIGIFLSLRQKDVNRSALSLLLTFFALVIVEYYITQSGVIQLEFGAARVLAVSDFLLTPFVGICISLLPQFISESSKLREAVASKMPRAKSPADLKVVVTLALVLLMSVQSFVTLSQAYPKNEVQLAPTAYEADAILYMNATAPRRFVVLSDTTFTNLAIGLLGEDYSYIGQLSGGAFGVSEWSYPIQQDYVQLVNDVRTQSWNASFNVLSGAQDFAFAQTVYFVVSERLADFEDVVTQTSQILQVDRVFGDGKLYLFKYPTPTSTGVGPNVKVTYEDGTVEEVPSDFSYTTKSEVSYALRLSGHIDYNISDYPMNWVFRSLTVNLAPGTYDNSSDLTSFIVLKGLNPIDRIRITWLSNDNYPVGKWKDDSFKTGWGPYPGYSYAINPSINTDGNILTLSWNFTGGGPQDYYYAKPVGISTDDQTYAIIRWKSSGDIAVSALYYFEAGTPETVKVQEIVTLGSYSPGWATSIVKLPPSVTISYFMVGISNNSDRTISGSQTLSVDYVLICGQT